MQILVADCSGEARISRLLSASAKADPRLTVFPMHPGTDANIARNQMLRAVQGAFVTTQGADEIAHPDRIDRQVAALRDDGCIAVLAQSVNVAPDGQLLAAWTPGFGFVSDAKGSLMARTETLQSLGGWDSVAQAGSAFLLWRIRRLGDAAAIRTVLPGVPLLAQIGVVADGQPTHVDFPYGRAQNQLRRLVWQARRAAAVDAGAPPQPVQPLTAAAEATDGKLDVVFVGDFAAKAVAIEQIRARVLSAAAGEGRVGLFHWPDCRHNLNTDIDESLTEAVDDGRLLLVGAFEDVKAIRLVLCNPYLANEPIDGLPDFEPDRFEVLFGPELHLEEFDDGDPRRLPSRAAIEGLTGRPFVWMSL